ncbi:MAG TPA: RDD family protein [Casimicrobiaceae bacterium]|nr:RDD family protein [Casimicrobiaceae bacterium]
MSAEKVVARDAGLVRRWGAAVYELLLLTALAFITQFALLPLVTPGHAVADAPLAIPSVGARTFVFCVQFAVFALYCTWFWTGGRRTLAQKTWSLGIVATDGRTPHVKQALIRYFSLWIGPALALAAWSLLAPAHHGRWAALALAFNFAWPLVDKGRHFLHDRIAGTRLIDTRLR